MKSLHYCFGSFDGSCSYDHCSCNCYSCKSHHAQFNKFLVSEKLKERIEQERQELNKWQSDFNNGLTKPTVKSQAERHATAQELSYTNRQKFGYDPDTVIVDDRLADTFVLPAGCYARTGDVASDFCFCVDCLLSRQKVKIQLKNNSLTRTTEKFLISANTTRTSDIMIHNDTNQDVSLCLVGAWSDSDDYGHEWRYLSPGDSYRMPASFKGAVKGSWESGKPGATGTVRVVPVPKSGWMTAITNAWKWLIG